MLLSPIPGISIIFLQEFLVDSMGCYILEVGQLPCIVINSKLKIGSDTYITVYNRLVAFHNTIPADSVVRLFSWERFYEELETKSVTQPVISSEPEIVMLGRFSREKLQCPVCISRAKGYRLIG